MDERVLRSNYYMVRQAPGTIGCKHDWETTSRQSVSKRWVVNRTCKACGRFERYLEYAPRKRRR